MLSDLLFAAVKLQEKPQTASGKIDLQKSSGYNTHRFGRMPVFVLQGVSAYDHCSEILHKNRKHQKAGGSLCDKEFGRKLTDGRCGRADQQAGGSILSLQDAEDSK